MPAPKNPFDELGDFGLVTPSKGTNASDQLGGLEELLKTDLISEVDKSRILGQQLEQKRAEEPSSFLQRLLEPGVLTALLGGGIAAATGEKSLAAGLGIGGVKRAELLGAVESQQRQKAIDELEERKDKADQKIDKMRGRLERLLISNPDLFISPGGTVPSPDVLGFLITGADIPLFPQTRRVADRRGKRWEAKLELLNTALTTTTTKEGRRDIAGELLNLLDWGDAPAGVVDALIDSFGTAQWDSAWGATLLRYGGATALNAMIYAGENGLSMTDPEVLRLIKFSGTDALQPSQILNARFIQLLDEVNEWQKQNPDQVLAIQESAGDIGEELRLIAEAALTGRAGDQALFLDKANLPSGVDLSLLLRAYGLADNQMALANIIAQSKNIEGFKNMTPEELQNYKINTGFDMITGAAEVAGQSVAKQQAFLRNRKMAELSKLLPDANDETIRTLLNIIMEGALERTRKAQAKGKDAEETSGVDLKEWERNIDALLPSMVEAYQKQRKAQK